MTRVGSQRHKKILVVFRLVNLYSLRVYIEHKGDESPKDTAAIFCLSFQAKRKDEPLKPGPHLHIIYNLRYYFPENTLHLYGKF
jgi:hypothetical protein